MFMIRDYSCEKCGRVIQSNIQMNCCRVVMKRIKIGLVIHEKKDKSYDIMNKRKL